MICHVSDSCVGVSKWLSALITRLNFYYKFCLNFETGCIQPDTQGLKMNSRQKSGLILVCVLTTKLQHFSVMMS